MFLTVSQQVAFGVAVSLKRRRHFNFSFKSNGKYDRRGVRTLKKKMFCPRKGSQRVWMVLSISLKVICCTVLNRFCVCRETRVRPFTLHELISTRCVQSILVGLLIEKLSYLDNNERLKLKCNCENLSHLPVYCHRGDLVRFDESRPPNTRVVVGRVAYGGGCHRA